MTDTRHTGMCQHDVTKSGNTLVVESHWSGASRIRCTVCGGTAHIAQGGEIVPEVCRCHGFRTDEQQVKP